MLILMWYIVEISRFHICVLMVFVFKQKTAYEMRISDWSSDVCSSDLKAGLAGVGLSDPRMEHGVHGPEPGPRGAPRRRASRAQPFRLPGPGLRLSGAVGPNGRFRQRGGGGLFNREDQQIGRAHV